MTTSNLYLPKKSVLLDGSTTYLELANQGTGVANLNPTGSDAFSISAWFYPNQAYGHNIIMSNQETASPYEGFAFNLLNSKLTASWYTSGGTNRYAFDNNSTTIDQRRWYCGVMTYDGSDNSTGFKIYQNGKKLELSYFSSGTVGTVESAAPIRIGDANWNGHFDGGLSNVAFWNKELSPAEITEIHRGRDGGIGPGDLRRHSAASNILGWWIADHPSDAFDDKINAQIGSYNFTANNLSSDSLQDLSP